MDIRRQKQLEAAKSGGFFGKGSRNGELQKAYQSTCYDSQFAMVCEEFGWIAAKKCQSSKV